MAFAASETSKFYHGFPTPGPQNPTSSEVMNHIYFATAEQWKEARESKPFDYIVIGSGFCALAFIDRIIGNAKKEGTKIPQILVLERGSFYLPEHFQNLPYAFKFSTPDQKFKSETFPWTLCRDAAVRTDGASWQHGMVPFFGGRSTLWSGWCPRPTRSPEELSGWPQEIINMMNEPHFFEGAEALLGVRKPSDVAADIPQQYRVYANLHTTMRDLLEERLSVLTDATYSDEAPLAIATPTDDELVTFEKFSVVGPFLKLLHEYPDNITVATNCCVSKIGVQGDDHVPTYLETSRGVLPLSQNTKIILGVGCMPAATLLLNSYPREVIPNVGNKFSAHFITAVTAKIPRDRLIANNINLNDFELGALYLGCLNKETNLTYHAQISILRDTDPVRFEAKGLKYMPDVVSTASMDQLRGSENDIVFVFAWLGELRVTPHDNFNTVDSSAADKASNVLLQYQIDAESGELWDAMDQTAEDVMVKVFAGGDRSIVKFWDFSAPAETAWKSSFQKLRVPGMVHESSVLSMGPRATESTGYDFRPYGTKNVYVTGSSLWPDGKSWNPTMTMCALTQRLADNLSHGGDNEGSELHSGRKKRSAAAVSAASAVSSSGAAAKKAKK